jgi:hypothetical protein
VSVHIVEGGDRLVLSGVPVPERFPIGVLTLCVGGYLFLLFDLLLESMQTVTFITWRIGAYIIITSIGIGG